MKLATTLKEGYTVKEPHPPAFTSHNRSCTKLSRLCKTKLHVNFKTVKISVARSVTVRRHRNKFTVLICMNTCYYPYVNFVITSCLH